MGVILAMFPAADDRPTLQELRKFPAKDGFKDIVAEIQNDYENLGIQLLNDSDGQTVMGIETAKRGHPLHITVTILRQWLQGKGRLPVTWQTLVECLRDAKLNAVAGYIDDAFSREGPSKGQLQQPSSGM